MTTKYEWAKIELLGHRVRYGRCSVVDFMDGKLLRVEVPFAEKQVVKADDGPEEEQFAFVEEYPFNALYCRTPMTEEDVRKAVRPWRPSTLASPQDKTSGHVEIDPWDDEDDSQPLRDVGKAMRCVLTPEDERLWNHKADEEAHEAPVVNETPRAPHFVDIDERSYVAAHIDLDECVRCHGGIKTHPLVSIDGSAVLGEHCLVCKATWWNQTPTMPTPAMVRPTKTT